MGKCNARKPLSCLSSCILRDILSTYISTGCGRETGDYKNNNNYFKHCWVTGWMIGGSIQNTAFELITVL
jgi:hypothetical protein